jgi:hypothetical protein
MVAELRKENYYSLLDPSPRPCISVSVSGFERLVFVVRGHLLILLWIPLRRRSLRAKFRPQ